MAVPVPELEGVKFTSRNELTGLAVHDAAVVMANLKARKRKEFAEKLGRLVQAYAKFVSLD